MPNIVIENSMLVDSNLQEYLDKTGIVIDKTFAGLKWMPDVEIDRMVKHILSGEKKNIFLATSYMEPEFIKEIFDTIHTNVASVSVFIYDSNAETIVMSFSRKYPAIKFTLLNSELGR